MSDNNKVVMIFTLPLRFPCGPNASCCGPIGQSEEDIKRLSDAIKNLGVEVEIYDIMEDGFSRRFPAVANLLGSFGPGIVPVLAIGDEIISIGTPTPEEAVQVVKEKL
ncbi:MAG: hypothetical protein NC822_01710 [Candidatus Omnitrophica bacterium]|nr:hypothetical protein [Candidatus Omnitrophota bacterium]MCM8827422.1 hypothetical protein [Candidatus Omnitrophota bacterium]